MSQNPDTKDYFMVLQDKYCEICGIKYSDLTYNWCRSCQINNLKKYPIKTSKNGKIDSFIQKMQSEFIRYEYYEGTEHYYFEWIPYDQFNDIREISKDDSIIIYLATWKDGPLRVNKKEWTKIPDYKVTLNCLRNSQNTANKFLKEV